jgi:hypothetical protein
MALPSALGGTKFKGPVILSAPRPKASGDHAGIFPMRLAARPIEGKDIGCRQDRGWTKFGLGP